MDVESFDLLDDMFRRMADMQRQADGRVQPWQAAIKQGDYFSRDSGYGFDIYGEVLKQPRRAKGLEHYRFCKCYSVACAEGEMGDVHVSTIERLLQREQFEQARR